MPQKNITFNWVENRAYQALQAILFLYRKVLEIELPWLDDVVRAKTQRRIPVVLSQREVNVILATLQGQHQLIGRLS